MNPNRIYGAPKITKELRKIGRNHFERTVGKYMKQMGIKAQWVKRSALPQPIPTSAAN